MLKKLAFGFAALSLMFLFLLVPKTSAQTADSPIRIAGLRTTAEQKYVMLYNTDDHNYDTEGLQVLYYPASRTAFENPLMLAQFDGILAAKSYVMIAQNVWSPPEDVTVDKIFTANTLAGTGGTLQLVDSGTELALFCWGSSTLCGEDKYAALPTGYAYQHCLDENGLPEPCSTDGMYSDYYGQTQTPYLGGGGFVPRPANGCDGLIISEIGANLTSEQQFIEVQNTNNQPLILSGCQLMTNRSTVNAHIFGNLALASGAYLSVLVQDTALVLTKTTRGTVYLLSSDSVEIDVQQYENSRPNTSWALLESTWQQTYRPTPGGANMYQEFPACPEGQERNPETGRCRNIPQPSVLADCGPGRYRHPETNRCRNTTSAGSTLKPCAANQYRNPETNRCRKIDSGSTLKPCRSDQERNPETNRCRKIPEVLSAATELASVPEAATKPPGFDYRIWGTLGAFVIGYGLYEYRQDARLLFERLRAKQSKHKPPG